jgi:hypothetical protein
MFVSYVGGSSITEANFRIPMAGSGYVSAVSATARFGIPPCKALLVARLLPTDGTYSARDEAWVCLFCPLSCGFGPNIGPNPKKRNEQHVISATQPLSLVQAVKIALGQQPAGHYSHTG